MMTSKERSRLHRNQLVFCTTAGILIGIVLAAYLGAFSGKDFENLSDWIAVLVASVAAGISFYAVRLVAHTLKATQDTLATTIQMAEDQKRIGNAQIRPWVLASEYKVTIHDWTEETAVIKFKNFGHTPARFIRIKSRLLFYEGGGQDKRSDHHDYDWDALHYIPPSCDITVKRDVSLALGSALNYGTLLFTVEYFDIEGNADTKRKPWLYEVGFKVYKDVRGPVIAIN